MAGMIEIRGLGSVPQGKLMIVAGRPNWQEMNERIQGAIGNVGMILIDPWADGDVVAVRVKPVAEPRPPIDERVATIIAESLLAETGVGDGIRRAAQQVLDEVRASPLDEALVNELAYHLAKNAGDADRFHCRPNERNRYLDTADGVMRDLIALAFPGGDGDGSNG